MINCKDCKGDCCRYIAVEIDEPETIEDFDEIRWFLAHGDVIVYIDNDDDWILEFRTKCRFLEDNKCKIYDTRPKICQDHGTESCVQNGEGEEQKRIFGTVEQVEQYMKMKFPGVKFPTWQ